MKVALISHSFPPHMTGGIGSYTFSLAEALTNKGIDVTVFCGGKSNTELPHKFKIKRLPMFNFPPRALWFQLQNFRFFKKGLKGFDIVHGQMTCTTFYSLIKNKVGKPWIVTFHDHPKRGLNAFLESPRKYGNVGDFFFNFLEYPIYKILCDIDIKKADKIISVSSSLSDDLVKYSKLNKKNLIVINNGIDINFIINLGKETTKKNNKGIRLLFFGRLFYGKGVTFLIDSMGEVLKINKNIQLDIYGEGPLKKVLEKQIKEDKLQKNVKLHNFLPNKEIIKEIYKSDIIILPSLYESFGLAYIETMACSKPVIAFNYDFSRDLIENNENGVLVKGKDTKKLAREVLRLSKDKKLREQLGKNAYNSVRDRFNLNNIVDKYIVSYKDVLKQDDINNNTYQK